MIAMTYGIDCVPVYPAANYAEIGEIAIDNDMLPEIEECSDAVIGLLDYEKVGKLLAERDNGIFVDGYYCMPDSYEEPDISLTIEVPDKRFFRVLVSPSATTTDQAQWFNLPEDIRRLREYSAEHNSTPEQMFITEVESVLPNISRGMVNTTDNKPGIADYMLAVMDQIIGSAGVEKEVSDTEKTRIRELNQVTVTERYMTIREWEVNA